MKLLYVGTDALQRSIAEALSRTRGDHEVLVAAAKEEFIGILEKGLVDVILFDCAHTSSLTLQQAAVYARAFKASVIALTSVTDDIAAFDLLAQGVGAYVFREHISQLPFMIGGMAENAQLERESQEVFQALERTGRYYQTLLKNIDDFVFLFDEKGDLLYLSPSASQLTGFNDLDGKQLFEYIYPEDRKKFFYLFKKVLKKPDARIEAHFRILHKNGQYIWIEGCITNLVKDDAIGAFVLSCRDVTARKETEQTLIRLNRLYASIRQINRAILSVEDELALFKEVCYVATAYGNFRMAFISLLDVSSRKLKLTQSSGVAEEDVEPSMVVRNLEFSPMEGVLQNGQSFVCNDVQNGLDAEYWKYVARQKGFGSFVILPLSKMGRIIGVFVLAATSVDAFTPKETELLEETVDDISFKLDMLERDKANAATLGILKHAPMPNWA